MHYTKSCAPLCFLALLSLSVACGGFPERDLHAPAEAEADAGPAQGAAEVGVDIAADDEVGPARPDPDASAGDVPDAAPDVAPEEEMAPLPVGIRVTLDPGGIVRPGVRVRPVVVIENEDGSPGDAGAARVAVMPNGAVLARGDRYEILDEGRVVFQACVATEYYAEGRVCASASVLSDAGPPEIEIFEPAPGARLSGVGPVIVRGRVMDTHGTPSAWVAGRAVSLDFEGHFETEMVPDFGVNHLVVVASDGVRDEESSRELDYLWSPTVLPLDGDSARLASGVSLRLAADFFDDDTTEDVQDGRVELDDIAAYVELLLLHADFANIAGGFGQPRYGIEVAGARAEGVDVDVDLRAGGFELRAEVAQLTIDFTGTNDDSWPRLPYDGTVETSATIYVRFELHKDGPRAPLNLRPRDLTVNLGPLQGEFENVFTQGAWDLVHDDVRGPVQERIQNGVVAGFVLEMAGTLSQGFAAADRALWAREFDVALPGGEATLTWGGEGTQVQSSSAALLLTAPVVARSGTQLDGRDGVAAHASSEPSFLEDGRVQAAVPLAAFNGPLHVIWGSGALDFDGRPHLAPALAGLLDSAEVTVGLPPVVAPSADPYHTLVLQLGQIEVALGYRGETARFGASVEVPGEVVLEGTALGFRPSAEPVVSGWVIEPGALAGISPEVIVGLLRAAVSDHLLGVLEQLQVRLPSLRFYPGPVLGRPGIPETSVAFSRVPSVRDGFLLLDAEARFSVTIE